MVQKPMDRAEPVFEDLVIAARVRQRLADDDGTRHTLEDVAAECGVDLDEGDPDA